MESAKKDRNEITRAATNARRKLSVTSLIFFTVSFLGWGLEMLSCSSWFTDFSDRGFLTLPFCVIYGAPVCMIFLLLGTPKEGILVSAIRKAKLYGGVKVILRYVLYFLVSALLATLFELIFGALFSSLGVTLWTYRSYSFNYKGYICLWFSLIWGALITFFMALIWPPLYRLFSRIPQRAAEIANVVLWIAVIADFSFNFTYLLLYKQQFSLILGVG